jgi:hypothetical protein
LDDDPPADLLSVDRIGPARDVDVGDRAEIENDICHHHEIESLPETWALTELTEIVQFRARQLIEEAVK